MRSWRADHDASQSPEWGVVEDATATDIAAVFTESKDDALLLAAAPDLLDALTRLRDAAAKLHVEFMKLAAKKGAVAPGVLAAIALADVAIAKAQPPDKAA